MDKLQIPFFKKEHKASAKHFDRIKVFAHINDMAYIHIIDSNIQNVEGYSFYDAEEFFPEDIYEKLIELYKNKFVIVDFIGIDQYCSYAGDGDFVAHDYEIQGVELWGGMSFNNAINHINNKKKVK